MIRPQPASMGRRGGMVTWGTCQVFMSIVMPILLSDLLSSNDSFVLSLLPNEGAMVWYGVYKTGFPEIDMDHSNIDYYLNSTNNHGLTQTTFDQLVKALILHFEREENLCTRLQLNMSAEHLAEHQRLSKLLQATRFEEKSEQEHLLFFKQTLMSHVSEFDMHINPDRS